MPLVACALAGLSVSAQPFGAALVEIALEQAQGCVKATTETTWPVMLVLLQSRERLPDIVGNRVAVEFAGVRGGTGCCHSFTFW
jgi:hypothetical protein